MASCEAEANALLDGAPAPKSADLDAAIQSHSDHTRKIENLRKASKRMERTLARERARVFAAAQARIDEIAGKGVTALPNASNGHRPDRPAPMRLRSWRRLQLPRRDRKPHDTRP